MPSSLATRWAVAAALTGFAAVSAVQLAVALSAEPWVRLALRMERASKPLDMPDSLRARLVERMEAWETGICGDLARSRVTVALDLLRRSAAAEPGSDAERRTTSAAVGAVHDAIRCNPSDGNLWYLLALLESRRTAGWERLQPLLAMSASLEPGEADLLFKRSRLAAVLLAGGTDQPDAPLKSDLRNALLVLDVRSATSILATLLEGGRQALCTELTDSLPESRKLALAEGPDPKRSSFGKAERFRSFEFRPFGDRPPR